MIDFYFFLVGSILASFLGLVIDRFPEQSIISPASHCDSCQTRLRPLDLIPIFSQVVNRFRCRYCKIRYPFWYALFELGLGLLFLAWSWELLPLGQVILITAGLTLGIYDLGHLRLSPSGISLTGLDDFPPNPHGFLWLESGHGLPPCSWNFGSFYRYPHGCRGFPLFSFLCSRL